ncbi:MAG: hypothetical protein K0R72_159 [Clostridia bacterium]|jgi:hypothetical protein|nr:hypothetical protein [Clostridia bacterium]
MRYCKSCKLNVTGNNQICPLCKNELNVGYSTPNVFPVIPSIYEEQNIVFKILTFASILAFSTCAIINYILSNTLNWSLLVLVGIFFFWFNLISSINKRNNPNAIIFNQVLMLSTCAIVYDYLTGFKLWSITYVLPALCIGAIAEMFIVSLILKYKANDYITYLLGTSVIGIIQIVFILLKVITVTWPSVICFILSIIMINTILLFSNRKCKKELRRKFHI